MYECSIELNVMTLMNSPNTFIRMKLKHFFNYFLTLQVSSYGMSKGISITTSSVLIALSTKDIVIPASWRLSQNKPAESPSPHAPSTILSLENTRSLWRNCLAIIRCCPWTQVRAWKDMVSNIKLFHLWKCVNDVSAAFYCAMQYSIVH